MQRIIMAVLAVLAVLILGIAGLAYGVGIQVETQYRAYLERNATESNLHLTNVHYRRGWFASDAVTRLQPSQDAANAENDIFLRHRIYHGLLPVGWWFERGDFSLRPVQAMVHTVLEGKTAWLDQLKTLYPEAPLVVISRIRLDGGSHHELFMPPLDIADRGMLAVLAFSGLHGQFHATPVGDISRGDIDVAALRIVGRKKLTGSSIRLRNLKFGVDQRRGRFQFMVGNSSLQLDELWLDNIDTAADSILLRGIRLLGKTTERTTVLDGNLELAVEKVAVDDKPLGNGQFQLSLTGLDGTLLRRIQQWSQTQILDSTDAGLGPMDEILPLFQGLLTRNPILKLETRVNTVQGTLELAAGIVLQEFSQIRLRDPKTLLQILARATIEISISKTLLEEILRKFLKTQLRNMALAQEQTIDESALDRYVTVRIQQQLAQWLSARFIEVTGDRYDTRGSYSEGRLMINGMRIPLWF